MDVNLPATVKDVLPRATCEPDEIRYRCVACGFGAKTVDGVAAHQRAEEIGWTAHHAALTASRR